MWTVYYKVEGQWVRLSSIVLPKAQAVRTFQNVLLGGAMSGITVELRKARDRDLFAEHIVTPSYGREYGSREEVLADWDAQRDFTLRNDTRQINKSDAHKYRKQGNGVIVIYGGKLCWIPYSLEK